MTPKERRARGLCWHCTQPAVDGKTRCAYHLDAIIKAVERFNQKSIKSCRCRMCGAEAVAGRRLCRKHLDHMAQYRRNKYWEAKRAARWLEVAEREQGYESGLKGAGE